MRKQYKNPAVSRSFSDEELTLMMLYNPGSREGLIAELKHMQEQLTVKEKELRQWTSSVLSKLSVMTDEEFSALELLP